MKSNRSQIDTAIAAIGRGQNAVILLYGPDMAQSRAIADKLNRFPEIEKIELSGAALKNDPAILTDEAASISLFSAARYIRVEASGDEILSALTLLIDVPAINNSVVIVTGNLKRESKLLKLALADKKVMAYASYLPEGENANRLVVTLGEEKGLRIRPDVAQRLLVYAENNRALLVSEIEKYALYLDSSKDNILELTHEVISLIGADNNEGNLARFTGIFFSKNTSLLEQELAALADVGVEPIVLIRVLLRRALLLADLSGMLSKGLSIQKVIESAGRKIFWKEKGEIAKALYSWRVHHLNQLITYLVSLECQIKQGKMIGMFYIEQQLLLLISRLS
ncbi:MAG: DNA polymerase III subunit delta [Zymomonas mobilis]|uniref:DNA-directed DNA polymerase n=1 Tax=Zymomonas mobilis TaxID=542 RepID=A0A542W2F8_ZYMMB|nr:DNA polymerase III subunit delta [Zymomonas mobilis]TQL17761.1 DNA polymerase III delta subunit [Zymomonas mobilis]